MVLSERLFLPLCKKHLTIFNHILTHGRNCSVVSSSHSVLSTATNVYHNPMEMYHARVKTGELNSDEYQLDIIQRLQQMHSDVSQYRPARTQQGLWSRIMSKSPAVTPPKGLYLYGSVGSGKTMLMDLFYDTCHIENKVRTHFHAFMLDVHKRIHVARTNMPRARRGQKQSYDPIPPVAKDIASEAWLLCFDEFQVTDIGDAMILKQLFEQLWQNGVVMIATSNRKPDDLYKNGLQRINFLPFIPMLKDRCDAINLDSGIDYRRLSSPAAGKLYFVKGVDTDNADHELDRIWKQMSLKETGEEGPRTLTALKRDLHFSKTKGWLLDTTFEELCKRNRGAVDYLEICHNFDAVFLRDVPRMTRENRNEARRFIILVDTLYDHRMRLIVSANAPIPDLFAHGDVSEWDKHNQRILAGDLNFAADSDNARASLFTGEEELFAFERVISRLTEMQTEDYWNLRHVIKEKRKRKQSDPAGVSDPAAEES